MSKVNRSKKKLITDLDSMIAWMDGGELPTGGYDTSEISGLRINLMLTGYNDIYVITVLPGDEKGTYDAWVRMMGNHDMVHVTTCRARDLEDAVILAMQHLPDALVELGGII